jgi:hypothetical protein
MNDRSIRFSAEMILAIEGGLKTQTRRVIKDTTEHRGPINPAYLEAHKNHSGWKDICPYGQPGDALFVPETEPRITLRITDIRVERLQDISEDDAKAEGCETTAWDTEDGDYMLSHRATFAFLWDEIKGAGAWDENPWVWVISFERVTP